MKLIISDPGQGNQDQKYPDHNQKIFEGWLIHFIHVAHVRPLPNEMPGYDPKTSTRLKTLSDKGFMNFV